MTSLKRGFTLVELLIVIAILGVIVVIVVAALNPIEQLNRSRDTNYKSASGQIGQAIERYYASRSKYPWVTVEPTRKNSDALLLTNISTNLIGICGDSCATGGELITNSELKAEFKDRDFVSATDAEDQIWVTKAQGANATVFVCYRPKSESERDKACSTTTSKVYDLSLGQPKGSAVTCNADSIWDSNPTWRVCVPE